MFVRPVFGKVHVGAMPGPSLLTNGYLLHHCRLMDTNCSSHKHVIIQTLIAIALLDDTGEDHNRCFRAMLVRKICLMHRV